MKPVEFPDQNIVWGGDGYLPLHAFVNDERTISCWSLTVRERLRLLWSGRLWLHQLNFGAPLQPQKLSLASPFDSPTLD